MTLANQRAGEGNKNALKPASERRTQTVTVRVTPKQAKKGGGKSEIALNMHHLFLESLKENPPLFSYQTLRNDRAEVMIFDSIKMCRVKYKAEKRGEVLDIIARVKALNEIVKNGGVINEA
jgi:hypothetical protein